MVENGHAMTQECCSRALNMHLRFCTCTEPDYTSTLDSPELKSKAGPTDDLIIIARRDTVIGPGTDARQSDLDIGVAIITGAGVAFPRRRRFLPK